MGLSSMEMKLAESIIFIQRGALIATHNFVIGGYKYIIILYRS